MTSLSPNTACSHPLLASCHSMQPSFGSPHTHIHKQQTSQDPPWEDTSWEPSTAGSSRLSLLDPCCVLGILVMPLFSSLSLSMTNNQAEITIPSLHPIIKLFKQWTSKTRALPPPPSPGIPCWVKEETPLRRTCLPDVTTGQTTLRGGNAVQTMMSNITGREELLRCLWPCI